MSHSISKFILVAALSVLPRAPSALAEASLFQPSLMTRVEGTDASAPDKRVTAGAPAAKEAPGEGDAQTRRLRHLPNNSQGYRLAGEVAASEWPVYFTQAQAAGQIRFQLGYLSAVSVMPEASKLTVQINDVTIGATVVQAPHAVKIVTFDIPPDLVKPGFNSLRVSMQQRHRVDCSLQATYELWTQIDPSQTGFIFTPETPGVTATDDVAALPPNPQGALPVRAMLPSKARAASIERMMRAVQQLAINGRFEQPLVDVDAGAAQDPYGINLAVGAFDELRALPGLEGVRAPEGPTLRLLPAQAGRATLVVTGRDDREVEAALATLADAVAPVGSEAGLRAARAFPGLRVRGGGDVSLKELGVVSQEFSGRLFRTSFQVVLPSDFYPADYGKVQLVLAGGYSAGLSTDAQVLVNVNGRNVVGVPLPKSQGEVFKERAIDLPLGSMRPGLNRVDIEAHLPTHADKSCEPTHLLAQKQRFLLLDSTRLIVPRIARIARMPDLAVTATGAFPYKIHPSNLYVPKPDRESLSAAATLMARLAVSGGDAMAFRLTTQAPPRSEATLVVSPVGALDGETIEAGGLSTSLLSRAWKDWADDSPARGLDARLTRFEAMARANYALQRNFPAACRMRGTSARLRDAARPSRDGAQGETLFDQWDKAQRDTGAVMSAARAALAHARQAGAWVVRHLKPIEYDDDPALVVKPGASFVLSQKHHGGAGVWTLATAPTSAALMESIACTVDPRVWMQVAGRVSALDSGEARMNALLTAEPRFVPTQPLSVMNTRLIAAGWFSLNRWTFVFVMLVAAAALGSATFWLVRNIGRREQ